MPATINEDASSLTPGPPTNWNPAIRVLVFLICLVPFLLLVNAVAINSMGPDPAEHLMHVTGEWVMRFLVLVLLATPLARYGWPRLARYRRMLGLYVWFYATLHLLVFAQVYIGWSGEQLVEELADRPYVLVGFLAWLILVPLGITSATQSVRKWASIGGSFTNSRTSLSSWVGCIYSGFRDPISVMHCYTELSFCFCSSTDSVVVAKKRFAKIRREANRPELLVNSQLCRIKRISA